jgi:hypothetical protein
MYTNHTFGFLVAEVQLDSITMPYNTPDVGAEPDFYIDFTAVGADVNPKRKPLDKDVFDSTFWQSKQINAVIMPWVPFFSNCDT